MRQTVSLQSRYRKRSFLRILIVCFIFILQGKILKEKGMRVNVQNTCPNDIIRASKTRKHQSGGCAARNKNSGGEEMKKVLALLVSCTLALSLAGCGSQTDSGQTAEGQRQESPYHDWL